MATSALSILIFLGLGLAGLVVAVLAVVYLIVPLFKGVGWLVAHVFRFVFGMIGDTLRAFGAVVTTLFLIPLTVGSIAIGRWSATSHYGRAVKGEVATLGRCIYRVFVGHPCRLFGLTALTEGLEKRLPEVMAAAPGADTPAGRAAGQFEGYTVVGSLPGGGSGGKLYVAEPTPAKLAALARQGHVDVYQVVVKSFSTHEGSSLPQIVRESRALSAARRLGLILEHALSDERFYYVMRYVPGEPLGLVTQRLHGLGDREGGSGGLDARELRQALAHGIDLLKTLRHYHEGGLWHKDVKPDNIIIHDGRAHLVDFGLVTSLRSSMTLTTHGTEYFRDPEMVRMALKGVKVHEVDGAKFDLYAAGAVLYSVIENSFPAHGGLSQISKRCPEALRWIVRRAMTDYDKRYDSAAAMLADLETVAAAPDPFALKPVALPSMGGSAEFAAPAEPLDAPELDEDAGPAVSEAAAHTPVPPPAPPRAPQASVHAAPRLTVVNWWTGAYKVDGEVVPHSRPAPVPPPRPVAAARTPDPRLRNAGRPGGAHPAGLSARDQVTRARARAAQVRARAHARMHRRRGGAKHAAGMNFGAGFAVIVFLAAIASAGFIYIKKAPRLGGDAALAGSPDPAFTGFDNGGEAPSQRYAARLTDGDGAFTVSAVATPAAAGAARAGGSGVEPPRIVVLHDRFRTDEPAEERAQRQVAALSDRFDIITGDGDDEIDTIGALRSAIGLHPFGAGGAARAVRDWLDAHEDIALVAWIDRDTDGRPATWLLGRRGLSETIVEDAYEALAEVEWAEQAN